MADIIPIRKLNIEKKKSHRTPPSTFAGILKICGAYHAKTATAGRRASVNTVTEKKAVLKTRFAEPISFLCMSITRYRKTAPFSDMVAMLKYAVIETASGISP
ncbi:MAG: hypothetical protein NTX59_09675 [Elusimicrobia bacterium]|nr:hypothetical protein [Elusimicrobiota bacterium]